MRAITRNKVLEFVMVEECIKFVLKSINDIHQHTLGNNLFHLKSKDRKTRSVILKPLQEPFWNKKLERNSMRFRGAKL